MTLSGLEYVILGCVTDPESPPAEGLTRVKYGSCIAALLQTVTKRYPAELLPLQATPRVGRAVNQDCLPG